MFSYCRFFQLFSLPCLSCSLILVWMLCFVVPIYTCPQLQGIQYTPAVVRGPFCALLTITFVVFLWWVWILFVGCVFPCGKGVTDCMGKFLRIHQHSFNKKKRKSETEQGLASSIGKYSLQKINELYPATRTRDHCTKKTCWRHPSTTVTDNLSHLSQQYIHNKKMLITLSPEKDKSCYHSYKYSTIQQTGTEHGQSCYSSPLKMPATETGETSGRSTFRTRPKSPKNPQQPSDPGCESIQEY